MVLHTDFDSANSDHGAVGLVRDAIDLLQVEGVGDELIASVAEMLENGVLVQGKKHKSVMRGCIGTSGEDTGAIQSQTNRGCRTLKIIMVAVLF